jgi:hypothetical protein
MYAGLWGGRWLYDHRLAHINADLPERVADAVVGHELAHGRWSVPLPEMRGQEGAARLALGLFDELRVEAFSMRAAPWIRPDIRAWMVPRDPGVYEVPNGRAAALLYGAYVGRVLTGALDAAEVADLVAALSSFGLDWAALDVLLGEVLAAAGMGDLIRLAHVWDQTATHTGILA